MSERKLIVSAYMQYILIGAGVLLLALFLRQIGGVLLTFLMAVVLAYALNPVVRRLERMRVPRVIAVLGVFTVLVVTVIVALLILIIPAIEQVQALVTRFMRNPEAVLERGRDLVNWARGLPYVGEYIPATLGQEDQQRLLQFVQNNIPPASAILRGALGFIGGVFGVFGTILNLLLMLIVSIYMLLDKERILRATLAAIPETVRDQVRGLFTAVEQTLMSYLKAQTLLCLIMGFIGWAIVFFFGGKFAHDYALVIGVWVGITELIPVLGAFLGAIPAVALALVDVGGQPQPLMLVDLNNFLLQALLVAGLFLVAQQIEGNILVPKVMGGSVGVHPLWVMFAMLAATALYGLVGALFAVPVVAIISATARYLQDTLVFERWGSTPVAALDIPGGGNPEGGKSLPGKPAPEEAGTGSRKGLEEG